MSKSNPTSNEILLRTLDIVQTLNAKALYLNGPPLSGKSYLLRALAQELPSLYSGMRVLGPYDISKVSSNRIGSALLQTLHGGYFDEPIPEESLNLIDGLLWFGRIARVASPLSVV